MPRKITQEEFIAKARQVHGDKYDYSRVKYVNASTRISIICPVHGEFEQAPYCHVNSKQGCPKCGVLKSHEKTAFTLDEFIRRSRLMHGDKYDYSKVEYKNINVKICITCPIHGEFWQSPNNHLRGSSCPKCSQEASKHLIYGFGINDYDGVMHCNRKALPSYSAWRSMISRCYNKNSIAVRGTYEQCFVCDEWRYYSNFKRWFDAQGYKDGYQLDKDIIVQGNKKYSPDTCCLVPQKINSIVLSCDKSRGSLRAGVVARKNKFIAQMQCNGKRIHIGIFNSEIEAFNAYKKAKKEYINQTAKIYFDKGEITMAVYNALLKWEVKEY